MDSIQNPSILGTCPPLELSNATFTPESAAAGGASMGTTVNVACDEGFEYQGTNPIVCKVGSLGLTQLRRQEMGKQVKP